MKKVLDWIVHNSHLAVRMLLQVMALTGGCLSLSLDPDTATMIASVAMMAMVTGYNIWKNFSVTDDAKQADKVLAAIREGLVGAQDILNYIEQRKEGGTDV